jgi:hypothetical protein
VSGRVGLGFTPGASDASELTSKQKDRHTASRAARQWPVMPASLPFLVVYGSTSSTNR